MYFVKAVSSMKGCNTNRENGFAALAKIKENER